MCYCDSGATQVCSLTAEIQYDQFTTTGVKLGPANHIAPLHVMMHLWSSRDNGHLMFRNAAMSLFQLEWVRCTSIYITNSALM